jgi:hypothetical protein
MLIKLTTPTNDYQKSIYPQLSTITQQIVDKYTTSFLQVSTPVARQVFGANLNGHKNDGSLYRSVNSGVNRSLTYGYAQFGQLVKVLTSRLRFIVNRDSQTVQRYKDSTEEAAAYVQLQTLSNEFLTYLSTVNDEWNSVVDAARTQHNIQKTKPVLRQRPVHQRSEQTERQPRQFGQQGQQQTRQPRQFGQQGQQGQQGQSRNQGQQNSEKEWVTVRTTRPANRTRSEFASQKTNPSA